MGSRVVKVLFSVIVGMSGLGGMTGKVRDGWWGALK